MKDVNIIQTAIDNLKKTTGFYAVWKELTRGDIDGVLTITINDKKLDFDAEVKKELRYHQLDAILNRTETGKPFIIIANKIFPKIKAYFREHRIAYLETNGNVFIEYENILIWIDGNKPLQEKKVKTYRAFTKAGIKLLFLYLLDQEWLNRPYREVAENAGVALGTVPIVITALKKLGFLVQIDDRLKLVNKEELINRWVEAYGEKLKPNIKLGNFMLDIKSIHNWKRIELRDANTIWGGEPAADLLTNNLNPDEFTLYTGQNTKDLIWDYQLLPQENGQVAVYEKFWKFPMNNQKTAPPLVVYADLINTGDSRCIETARIIYEQYLSKNI